MRLLELQLVFACVGVFGFGGGSALTPLTQRKAVDGKGWLPKAQVLDAFGNALPGPITTQSAGYVGDRMAGWVGAMAAWHVAPSAFGAVHPRGARWPLWWLAIAACALTLPGWQL